MQVVGEDFYQFSPELSYSDIFVDERVLFKQEFQQQKSAIAYVPDVNG